MIIKTPIPKIDIERPSKDLIKRLEGIGSATASGELRKLGIKAAVIDGLTSFVPGKSVVGPAITLQYMPKREDQFPEGEYRDPESQVHRHALYHVQSGDIIVVDGRGEISSGVFGEMMLTYLKGKGGLGIVIDGAIRDYGDSKELGLGMWMKGVTPYPHTQTVQFPYAYNVPIDCAGTLVMPGDIIIADDDGAVVVPAQLAEQLAEVGGEHAEWEVFVRIKLAEGGDLRKYYPMTNEARAEYEVWKKTNG
ncbi:MAG: ribonuclease activity regulator RraA [Chloroflexi bacterium]|nr:ribonuclease activity regulator RraA [Chloroflexota bacterium]MDA1282614.1 ribonuclease activity regulator RraA [Chloroflexota bacterium]